MRRRETSQGGGVPRDGFGGEDGRSRRFTKLRGLVVFTSPLKWRCSQRISAPTARVCSKPTVTVSPVPVSWPSAPVRILAVGLSLRGASVASSRAARHLGAVAAGCTASLWPLETSLTGFVRSPRVSPSDFITWVKCCWCVRFPLHECAAGGFLVVKVTQTLPSFTQAEKATSNNPAFQLFLVFLTERGIY